MTYEPVLRRCGCGRAFTPTAWAALDLVGHQIIAPDPTETDRPEGYTLQLRNCPCGSTLAVEVVAPVGPALERYLGLAMERLDLRPLGLRVSEPPSAAHKEVQP